MTRVALAFDPRLVAPMEAVLAKGNAVDAVVCGLFAASALAPSVLLGPAQILVGGTGAGLRAIDGRARQPGLGTKRPRGARAGDEIARAATVAVPGLPAAALVAHAAHGKAPMSAIASAVVPLARAASPARAAVLSRVLGAGAAALAKETELLAAAGPVAGGILTADDLRAVRPAHVDCALDEDDGGWTIARAPWESVERPDDHVSVRVVLAVDARGTLAVACYEVTDAGLAIDALGLLAPSHAEPVRRGVPRIAPGAPLPAACPIAIARGEGFVAAFGAEDEAIVGSALAAARGTKPLPAGSIGAIFSAKRARALPGCP